MNDYKENHPHLTPKEAGFDLDNLEFLPLWLNSEYVTSMSKEEIIIHAQEIGFETENELLAYLHEDKAKKKEANWDNQNNDNPKVKPATKEDVEGLFF